LIAAGRVAIERSGNRSVIVGLTAKSPLKILAPRSLGGAAWIYTTSYGGGLVDGDALHLDLTVGAATMMGYHSPEKMLPTLAAIAAVTSGSMPPNQPLPMWYGNDIDV
jgi:hypothetical protein